MVWGAIAIAAIQTGISYSQSKSAGDAAKGAAKLNADNIRAETAETIRRTEAQNKRDMGSAVAMMGGSGARMSGSPLNYLNSMEAEQQRQVDWMQEAGDRAAKIAQKTGQNVAANYKYGAVGDAANIWGGMYSSGAFDSTATSGYSARSPNAPANINSNSGGFNNNYDWNQNYNSWN